MPPAPTAPANLPSPLFESFRAAVSMIAHQHGIQDMLLIAVDPQNGAERFVATPTAKARLTPFLATKLGLSDPADTAWEG